MAKFRTAIGSLGIGLAFFYGSFALVLLNTSFLGQPRLRLPHKVSGEDGSTLLGAFSTKPFLNNMLMPSVVGAILVSAVMLPGRALAATRRFKISTNRRMPLFSRASCGKHIRALDYPSISQCDIYLRAFENEFGVQPPLGYWDPLGFTRDGDEEAFKRRRETELKHGRIAMLATIGYMMPEFTRFPGDLSSSKGFAFVDIPNGLEALREVPSGGWFQIFLWCGCTEKAFFMHDPKRPPGDYKMAGVLGVPNGSSMPKGEERNHKLHAEVANSRLAMMAIIGMFFQDGLTGGAWGDWNNYTASPLRQTPRIIEEVDGVDLTSLG